MLCDVEDGGPKPAPHFGELAVPTDLERCNSTDRNTSRRRHKLDIHNSYYP